MDRTPPEEPVPHAQPGTQVSAETPGASGGRSALDRAFFAPGLFLALLVIVLTGTASLRIPLREVVMPFQWVLLAGLAGWLCVRRPAGSTVRPLILLTLLAGLACWLGMMEYSARVWPSRGDLFSMHPDNWSYQAISDYLYRYRRGRLDGMPFVDTFGSHLANTRFATPAMLALLQRTFLPHDLPMACMLLLGMCLTIHFFSMLALGRALVGHTEWTGPLCAAFLSTGGGWFVRAIENSNYDNLIFAALIPLLLALLCAGQDPGSADRPRRVNVGRIAAGALLFGAMIYNYPEGIALGGILASPLLVALLWPTGHRRITATRWAEAVSIGVLGTCLAIPYLPTFITFLRFQMLVGAAAVGIRPGDGVMTGLVSSRWLPSLFALGEEFPGSTYRWWNNLLPLGLCVLVFLGARALGRRHRWFPWVAVPLSGLFLWQNVWKHYDYGSFKVLLCAEWWTYLAIGAGCSRVCTRFSFPAAARVAGCAALLAAVGYEKYEDRRDRPPVRLAEKNRTLSELTTIPYVTGGAPVLLAVDEEMDYVWATYYLSGVPLATWQQKGYLAVPQVAPYLARSPVVPPSACPYMLVSGISREALWHNTRFSLIRRPPVYIANIENPLNGVEMSEAVRCLWLTTKATTFQVVAEQAGAYELSAAFFGVGPSAPDQQRVAIEIVDAGGAHPAEITNVTRHLPITLAQGKNVVQVRCLGTASPGPHSGDPRELMVLVRGPGVNSPGAGGP